MSTGQQEGHVGVLSPDGTMRWDGKSWTPVVPQPVSPDGLWRWSGQHWQPNSPKPPTPEAAAPSSVAAPFGPDDAAPAPLVVTDPAEREVMPRGAVGRRWPLGRAATLLLALVVVAGGVGVVKLVGPHDRATQYSDVFSLDGKDFQTAGVDLYGDYLWAHGAQRVVVLNVALDGLDTRPQDVASFADRVVWDNLPGSYSAVQVNWASWPNGDPEPEPVTTTRSQLEQSYGSLTGGLAHAHRAGDGSAATDDRPGDCTSPNRIPGDTLVGCNRLSLTMTPARMTAAVRSVCPSLVPSGNLSAIGDFVSTDDTTGTPRKTETVELAASADTAPILLTHQVGGSPWATVSHPCGDQSVNYASKADWLDLNTSSPAPARSIGPDPTNVPVLHAYASLADCQARLPGDLHSVQRVLAMAENSGTGANVYSEDFASELGRTDPSHPTPSSTALFAVLNDRVSPADACASAFPTSGTAPASTPVAPAATASPAPSAATSASSNSGVATQADITAMTNLMSTEAHGYAVAGTKVSTLHAGRFAVMHETPVPAGSGQDAYGTFWRASTSEAWQLLEVTDGTAVNGVPADVMNELGLTSCGVSPACPTVDLHK